MVLCEKGLTTLTTEDEKGVIDVLEFTTKLTDEDDTNEADAVKNHLVGPVQWIDKVEKKWQIPDEDDAKNNKGT